MERISLLELLGLSSAIVALLLWVLQGRTTLRKDSVALLTGLVLLTILLNLVRADYAEWLTNLLEEPLSSYLDILQRILWGVCVYSFVQSAVGRQFSLTRKQSEALLSHLGQRVYFKNPNLVYVTVNPAFATNLGLTPEQIIGKTDRDIYPSQLARQYRAEDEGIIEKGESVSYEKHVDANGDKRIVRVSKIPVPGEQGQLEGLLGIVTDITEQAQAERASAHLAAIVQASDDAIIGTSTEGIITSWNQGARYTYGYDAEDFIGRSLSDLVPPVSREKLQQTLRQVAGGSRFRQYETLSINANGQQRNIAMTLSPVYDQSDQVTGISVIGRDITEQVRLRDELRLLSLIDPLTKLHNRRGFYLLGEQQLKVTHRTQNYALLIFADLDNMKRINDTLGHQTGDQALLDTAQALRITFRESDIIGRLGGDEFAILALDTVPGDREELVERLQETLEEKNDLNDRPYKLSLSIGCVRYDPGQPQLLDELLAEADALMYEDKRRKSTRHGDART